MGVSQQHDLVATATSSRAKRKVRYLFAAMAVVVIGTTLVTYFSGNRVLGVTKIPCGDPSQRNSRSRRICSQLLTNAEAGQRGFYYPW